MARDEVDPPPTDSSPTACLVCQAAGPFRRHQVPLHRYGRDGRPPASYLECLECGSLLLHPVPDDSGTEYGKEYHALHGPPGADGTLGSALRRIRDRWAVTGKGLPGGILATLFPPPLEGFSQILRFARARPDDRILDVGTSTGSLLSRMREAGFSDLTGIDPYLPADPHHEPGFRLLRMSLNDLEEEGVHEASFDLVMFNHSLEHVPNPEVELERARRLLSSRGRILVRTPVIPSDAWEMYGTDWVQLDAPRHQVIFSRTGLPLLAERVGLRLEGIRDDSTEVQFLGSELYREGRPLHDFSEHFSWRERRRRRRKARRLNARSRGDQAAFLFSAASDVRPP